jgi:hypothetical protein
MIFVYLSAVTIPYIFGKSRMWLIEISMSSLSSVVTLWDNLGQRSNPYFFKKIYQTLAISILRTFFVIFKLPFRGYGTLTSVKYILKRKIIWGYRPWSFLNHFCCFLFKNNEDLILYRFFIILCLNRIQYKLKLFFKA